MRNVRLVLIVIAIVIVTALRLSEIALGSHRRARQSEQRETTEAQRSSLAFGIDTAH